MKSPEMQTDIKDEFDAFFIDNYGINLSQVMNTRNQDNLSRNSSMNTNAYKQSSRDAPESAMSDLDVVLEKPSANLEFAEEEEESDDQLTTVISPSRLTGYTQKEIAKTPVLPPVKVKKGKINLQKLKEIQEMIS